MKKTMPLPKENESKNDFISRCIPYVKNEGVAKNTEQAIAICNGIWDKHRQVNKKMKKRMMLHLDAKLNCFIKLNDKGKAEIDMDRCTMIVGDNTFNGVYLPCEELEKSYKSFEGKPININHSSETVEDIVGYMKDVKFEDGKITCKPVFDEDTVKYPVVIGYINSRFNAGDIPNVSIGVWLDTVMEKMGDGEQERLVGRELEGDHLAVVVHGACNPDDGCGIGICSNNSVTISHDDYVAHDEEYEKLNILIELEKEKKQKIFKEEENV